MDDSRHQDRLQGRSTRHVTEPQIAQQSLGDSDDLYRDLVESSQNLLYTHDLQGKLLSVDPTTARLLGYEVEELLRIPLPELLAPKSRDQFNQYLERIQKNGVDGGLTVILTQTGGRRVWRYLNTLRSDELRSPTVRGVAHDVTERVRAEEELRRSEERYRSLIVAIAEGVVVLDAEGKITTCNPAAERILGLPTGQLIGRTLMDLRWGAIHEDGSPFPVEDHPALLTLRTGQPQLDVCMGIQKPDGTRMWINVSSQVILRKGEILPHSVVTSFVDITERKRTEEALRVSEKRYRRFVERNTAGVLVNTPDGRILQTNDALIRMLGYGSVQEILALTTPELYADLDDRAGMIRLLKEKKALSNYELRFKCKDGGTVSVLASISLVEDGEDVIEGTLIDISERKRAQDALLEERRLLRTLIDNMPDCIYVKDAASRFLVANCGVAQLMGAKNPNDLLGRTDFDFFPKELATAYLDDEQAIIKSGKTLLNQEEASVDAAGNAKWLLTSKVPIRDQDGQVIGIVGIGRDITIRKQTEKELRESEERFTKAFYSSPEGMSISTLSHQRIIEVNDAALRIWGYERSEVIGKTARELAVWVNPAEVSALLRGDSGHGPIRDKKTSIRTKSGVVRQVRISAETIQSQGEPCFLIIFRDVTEQETLEDQLRQAQKMEAVGLLAGGISHDFNNLLNVIQGNADLLMEEVQPGKPQHYAEEIKKATQRATELTRQLLAFSRKQVLRSAVLDLNAVVGDVVKTLRHLIGEDVQIVVEGETNLASIWADPGQVEQILMNLATNARDAMPNGGMFTIRTENAELGPNDVARHPYVVPGRYVRLSVRDTGLGMSEDIRSRAFEPFFTTKPPGRGTGLGLATVFGIVKQSGGYVWISSAVGAGTAFDIYFPRVDEAAPALGGGLEVQSEYRKGTETILVLEDEESLREVTCTILTGAGYSVLQAGQGGQAIALARQYMGPIHLMISDVILPDISGPSAMAAVQASHPETGVLFVSGYAEGFAVQRIIEAGVILLQKPVSRSDLLREVDEILHPRNPSTEGLHSQ